MKAGPVRSFVLATLATLFIGSPAHAAFAILSGTVEDQNGVPLPGITVNFVDSCTGVTAGATGNITSATGTFSATVIAGIYEVDFSPPVGSLYAAQRFEKYDLTTSKSIGVVKLANGVAVTGQVTDTAGAPIASVYLHFFTPGTTRRIYTVHDKTDVTGNYSVVVTPGTYDLRYGPQRGTPYLALPIPSVIIPGNITLPTVTLQTGLAITGTLLDSVGAGSPVINVNINAIDTITGVGVTLAHDRTDANGMYDVIVPPGNYFFEYEPEKCTLLAGAHSAATPVSADTVMPTVNLPAGVLVKGQVNDTSGAPVFDVNTDYFNGVGDEITASDDHTDTTGAFSTVLIAGTYSITYSPPRGLRLAGVKASGIVVSANPTIVPTVVLPTGYYVSGRVVDSAGTPVSFVDVSFFSAGTSNQVYVAHGGTDSMGTFSIVSVPGTYDIRFSPIAASGLVAVKEQGVVIAADTSLPDIVLPFPAPMVTSIVPGAGTAAGGDSVTVNGTGFRALAGLTFGGLKANVVSVSSTGITATTPARPAGVTDVMVSNTDGQAATLPQAYTFQEPAASISLTATLSGNDVILTWTSTGQASYTVFGNSVRNAWPDGAVLTRTALTTYTVSGAALTRNIEYFDVE